MQRFISTKVTSFDDYELIWIKVDLSEFNDLALAESIYSGCIQNLHEKNSYILSEKVFGTESIMSLLSEIKKKYIDNQLINPYPTSYIYSKRGIRFDNSCCSIVAIRPLSGSVSLKYINDKKSGQIEGTYLKTKDTERLYLTTLNKRESGTGFTASFYDLTKAASEFGFTEKDLIRTWFYLDKIGLNYTEFNQNRNQCYQALGIDLSAQSDHLPSSTCVGKNGIEDSLNVEAWFIKRNNENIRISRIFNPFQKEPDGKNYMFQPAFSRAILIETHDYRELQLSGTASIGINGETLFPGDTAMQIKTTFENVSAILHQSKMDFQDFCLAYCYLKNPEDAEIFHRIIRDLKIKAPNSLLIFNDICRPDLTFEIDGIAIKKIRNDEK